MGRDRFQTFTAVYLDTDLWIGYVPVGRRLKPDDLKPAVENHIRRLRAGLTLIPAPTGNSWTH